MQFGSRKMFSSGAILVLGFLSLFSPTPGVNLTTTCNKIIEISDDIYSDGTDGCCLVVNGTCRTTIYISDSCKDGNCSLVNETESLFGCSSLQTGLELASEQEHDNCTDIILLSGRQYAILSPVTIKNSLVLRSGDPGKPAWVTVSSERTPQPPNYAPFYILTISDAELVTMEGVKFSGSSGIINIESVMNVTVSQCSFRYVTIALKQSIPVSSKQCMHGFQRMHAYMLYRYITVHGVEDMHTCILQW